MISRVYQNGIELDSAYPDEEIAEYDNTYKSVQDGGTLDIAFMYKLSDDSDISIELSPIICMDNSEIGKYTFKLES